jgi:hypothetical protein
MAKSLIAVDPTKASGSNYGTVLFMTRDKDIIGCLDEHWRTVIQIRSCLGRFGLGGSAYDLTTTLHRLADAGEIERQTRATEAPGRRGNKRLGQRSIEFFRSHTSK